MKLLRITEMGSCWCRSAVTKYKQILDNWNASGVAKTGRGRRRISPFSCYVNCITERLLDISVTRKKNQITLVGVPLLLVAATRSLNIHILAGVNFKILSWMSNFSFIARRASHWNFSDLKVVKCCPVKRCSQNFSALMQKKRERERKKNPMVILFSRTEFLLNQLLFK